MEAIVLRGCGRAFHINRFVCTGLFRTLVGAVGNLGRFHPPAAGFSKSPHLHSSVLENFTLMQTSLSKPFHPSFHFSSVNDGYYYLFSLFFYFFPNTRRSANPGPDELPSHSSGEMHARSIKSPESREVPLFSTRILTRRFYYLSMGSILAVLALSANTAFADFPRLCQIVAEDGYLPHAFSSRGRRLVFSHGIYVLVFLAGLLLIVFGGITDRLIPLFAVGAFLAFTLSQAGMVVRWRRLGGPGAWRSMLINGLGATATAVTVVVVLAAKFAAGAWVTVLLIPSLLIFMNYVNRHYRAVASEVALDTPLDLTHLKPPIVIMPIQHWNKIAEKGLRFAINLSTDIHVLQVRISDNSDDLRGRWCHLVEQPAMELGVPIPKLTVVESPYRLVFRPILAFVNDLAREHPDSHIAVLIPEMVESHWFHYFLHNQRAAVLKGLLLVKGNKRINVINVPWYIFA